MVSMVSPYKKKEHNFQYFGELAKYIIKYKVIVIVKKCMIYELVQGGKNVNGNCGLEKHFTKASPGNK